MNDSMGMIQVQGVTYRVVNLGRNDYEIFRLLDDTSLGSFHEERASSTYSFASGENSLREVARIAVRQGKTKWKPTVPASRYKAFAVARMATLASFFLATRPQKRC